MVILGGTIDHIKTVFDQFFVNLIFFGLIINYK